MYKNDWVGILATIGVGLLILQTTGCVTWHDRGYQDSAARYRGEKIKYTNAWEYHLGVMAYDLERGRSMRWKKQNGSAPK